MRVSKASVQAVAQFVKLVDALERRRGEAAREARRELRRLGFDVRKVRDAGKARRQQ